MLYSCTHTAAVGVKGLILADQVTSLLMTRLVLVELIFNAASVLNT